MTYDIVLVILASFLYGRVQMQATVQRLALPDGASCGEKLPGYLVTDSHKLLSDDTVFYEDVEEDECKIICSDNKDDRGTSILCSSFNYNLKSRLCIVNRGKARPAGKLQLKKARGQRYYEKICLPEGSPSSCGDAPFFRANQVVLVGYAKNVTSADDLSGCISHCVKTTIECKSAMFFPQTKECIVNSATAQGAPDAFIEEGEKNGVVYFENGCAVSDQVRKQKAIKTSTGKTPSKKLLVTSETEKSEEKEDTPISGNPSEPPSSSTSSTDDDEEEDAEDKAVTARSLLTGRPSEDGFGPWSAWSKCDKADGRRIRKRKCPKGKQCNGLKIEAQSCKDIDPSEKQEAVLSPDAEEEETGSTLDASEEAGTESVTTQRPSRRPKITRAPKQTSTSSGAKSVIGDAWTPWSEECRPFDEPNACRFGTRLGFQMRQCTRAPFECQGTFFRYCITRCF